jgi:hypothetical protein
MFGLSIRTFYIDLMIVLGDQQYARALSHILAIEADLKVPNLSISAP